MTGGAASERGAIERYLDAHGYVPGGDRLWYAFAREQDALATALRAQLADAVQALEGARMTLKALATDTVLDADTCREAARSLAAYIDAKLAALAAKQEANA